MNSSQEKQQRFLALFQPVQASLERYVLALTGDRETGRDVVAETVLIAYERFETLRTPAAFLSFLFTIATRVHRQHLRVAKRTESIGEEQIEQLFDPGLMPDVAADIGAVYRALGKLPEKQREAVVLFEIMGVPMKEIVEIQGGTLTAVKVRISRGRKRLSVLLGVEDRERSEVVDRREARPDGSKVDETGIYSIGVKP
ncbi:MAG: RNA polymerase sigma factor [Candidatus Kapaibacterium sp.]